MSIQKDDDISRNLWVPHEIDVYSRGKILKECIADGHITIKTLRDGLKFEVLRTETHVVDKTHLLDLDDLCDMNNLHEAPLLDIIRRRLLRDIIYTYIGSFLLSLNPYKSICGLYDEPLRYLSIPGENIDSIRKQLTPHVYAVANQALSELVKTSNDGCGGIYKISVEAGREVVHINQSIIITGESGAGKTEASKHVMTFLTLANSEKQESSHSEGLGEQLKNLILQSNSIFESFGNAKTLRNSNSSRFGKYIKLEYSIDNVLLSSYTETFLLERSRLVSVSKNERNYHIFYRLIRGLPRLNPTMATELMIERIDSFNLLTDSIGKDASADVDVEEDLKEFDILRRALSTVGCTDAEFSYLWQMLACILHLGNLTCSPSCSPATDGKPVEFLCPTMPLGIIAESLGVDVESLSLALSTRVISAGGLPPSVKLLSPAEAKNNVSATIKWLYRSMFSWLVRKINHANGNLTDAGVGERVKFIGILDIFGFEILEVNSFEQLCINYSNERLQQQFNERVFVEEQKKYESEGLDGSKITFRDNQHVVDLISHRPAGLLIMLEEYSMLNRKNSGLLNTYHNTHSKQSSHPAYSRRRFRDDEGFIVKHFAGDVDYTIENFIEKNNDALQPGITELLSGTTNVFLRNAIAGLSAHMQSSEESAQCISEPGFVPMPKTTSPRLVRPAVAKSTRMASLATVSGHFRNQLDNLIASLRATRPHYIKCIKPNESKQPEEFDAQLVMRQLRYSGVLEVVRIRREGYPSHAAFCDFYAAHHKLAHGRGWLLPTECTAEQAKEYALLLAHEFLLEGSFQIGNNSIFLSNDSPQTMVDAEEVFLNEWAVYVQTAYRRHSAQRALAVAYNRIRVVQSYSRMRLQRWQFQRAMRKVVVLQRYACRWRLMQRLREIRAAQRLKRETAAAVTIQRLYRGYRTRQWYKPYKRKYVRAQVRIASVLRMTACQARYQHLRVNCVRIQAAVRRMLCVQWYRHQVRCTCLLQRVVRSFISRCAVKSIMCEISLKVQQRTHFAAVRIQSRWRSRCEIANYRRISMAVAKIRKFLLSKILVHISTKKTAACVRIQSLVRAMQQQKRYRRLQAAAVYLQAVHRGCIARRTYHALLDILRREGLILGAVVWTQARVRRFIHQCGYRRLKNAVRIVQSAFRAARRNGRVVAFHQACRQGDIGRIRQCLLVQPELRHVRNRFMHFCTAHQSAAMAGQCSVLRVLGTTVEDVLQTDAGVDSLLHSAMHCPDLETVQFIWQIVSSVASLLPVDIPGSRVSESRYPELKSRKSISATQTSPAVVNVVSGQEVLKEGWAMKSSGSFLKGDRRRWFVLTRVALLYFKSDKDVLPCAFTAIRGCDIVRATAKHGATSPSLSVVAPGAVFKRSQGREVRADSIDMVFTDAVDCCAWLKALRAVAGVKPFRSTSYTLVNVDARSGWVNRVNKLQESALHKLAASDLSRYDCMEERLSTATMSASSPFPLSPVPKALQNYFSPSFTGSTDSTDSTQMSAPPVLVFPTPSKFAPRGAHGQSVTPDDYSDGDVSLLMNFQYSNSPPTSSGTPSFVPTATPATTTLSTSSCSSATHSAEDLVTPVKEGRAVELTASLASPSATVPEQLYEETLKVAAWLLCAGCDLNAKSAAGLTPLQLAIAYKNNALAVFLKGRGADESVLSTAQSSALATAAAATTGNLWGGCELPPCFIPTADYHPCLPAPAKTTGLAYLSMTINQLLFNDCTIDARTLEDAYVSVFIESPCQGLQEPPQDFPYPVTAEGSLALWWGHRWHMQTALEDCEDGSTLAVRVRYRQPPPRVSRRNVPTNRSDGRVDGITELWGHHDLNRSVLDSGRVQLSLAIGGQAATAGFLQLQLEISKLAHANDPQ